MKTTQKQQQQQVRSVEKMLTEALDICREHGKNSAYDAFNKLLEWLGEAVMVNPNKPSLPRELCIELNRLIDWKLLLENLDDHLGRLYSTLELNNEKLGQTFTPMQVAEMMAQNLKIEEAKQYATIYDPCAGTGVMFLAAMKHTRQPVIFYGVEIDLTVYRACLIQLALYSMVRGHLFQLVRGDALKNDFSWSDANKWW